MAYWVMKNYREMVKETILAIYEEIKGVLVSNVPGTIIKSSQDAYALASRFEGVLYKHPYFMKKHIRILNAIIDRCGEAYHYKVPDKLYVSNEIVDKWEREFNIPKGSINRYLKPLMRVGILIPSDRPEYRYRISNTFFELTGPVAQYLINPDATKEFINAVSAASGLASIHVVKEGTREESKTPTVPSFLKLSMVYTLAGLKKVSEEGAEIDDILHLKTIHFVDNILVREQRVPVEWLRSVRVEAFDYMIANRVIEDTVSDGYRLNELWVRMHEEGIRRYYYRIREELRKRRF